MKKYFISAIFLIFFQSYAFCQFDNFYKGYLKYVNDTSWLFSDYTYRFRGDLSLGFAGGGITTNFNDKKVYTDSTYYWLFNGKKLKHCEFNSRNPINLESCYDGSYNGSKVKIQLFKNNNLYFEAVDSFLVPDNFGMIVTDGDSLIHHSYKSIRNNSRERFKYDIHVDSTKFKIKLLNKSNDEDQITVVAIKYHVLKPEVENPKPAQYGVNIMPPQLHLYQYPFGINRYIVLPKGVEEFSIPSEMLKNIPVKEFEIKIISGKKVKYTSHDGKEIEIFSISNDFLICNQIGDFKHQY